MKKSFHLLVLSTFLALSGCDNSKQKLEVIQAELATTKAALNAATVDLSQARAEIERLKRSNAPVLEKVPAKVDTQRTGSTAKSIGAKKAPAKVKADDGATKAQNTADEKLRTEYYAAQKAKADLAEANAKADTAMAQRMKAQGNREKAALAKKRLSYRCDESTKLVLDDLWNDLEKTDKWFDNAVLSFSNVPPENRTAQLREDSKGLFEGIQEKAHRQRLQFDKKLSSECTPK